jgi:chaperonin GroES
MPATETKVNIKPLYDNVIIETIETEQTAGGIYIPDTARDKPQRGVVLAIGTGRLKDDGSIQPLQVSVGNTVLFRKYAGTQVKLDTKEVTVITEKDIIGIIEE